MSKAALSPSAVMSVFTADIKSDNVHVRLFTAGKMYLIAAAIGPEHVRSDLIPFISNEKNFDGEVKAIIAEQLGGYVKLVGGPQYAPALLNPLKVLLDAEDLFVREKAIQSTAEVCNELPAASSDVVITNLLNGLFTSQFTTSKIAACALLPQVYEKITDQSKSKLRRLFVACIRDEFPIVRRAALESIPKACAVMKTTAILGEIVRQPLMERLTDDDESIRVIIPNCLPSIAAKIATSERVSVLIPMAKTLVKDNSWWVRANMAKILPDLVPYFGSDITGTDIGAIILFLLRDPDPEVKTAACLCCKQIVDVLLKSPNYFIESVLPEIESLATDKFKQVREEVAADILYFARVTGPTVAREKVYPIVASLIDDKERDVVIAVLRGLPANFGSVDSYDVTQAVLSKLIEVATKEDWRVKVEIIKNFRLFLPFITPEAIINQVLPLVSKWLQDNTYSVREEMAKTLPDFITLINNDTIRDEIISLVLRLNYSSSYSVRQAAILCVWHLSDILPTNIFVEKLLPCVLFMTIDPVVNVRILVAKTLRKIKNNVDNKDEGKISSYLKTLENDKDQDVKYFARH